MGKSQEKYEHKTQQRNTPQKQAIESALKAAARPLTPQEVLEKAQQLVPKLGIATVYRNLKLLQQEGCARTVELPAEATRYEAICPKHGAHHHHHFLCTQCDRAFDVEGCANGLASMLPKGFEMVDHDITLYGFCSECTEKR